jgi:UDPglucose 6-dehydrogenase
MKITIIGTGYVGLVTGTCFAETGILTTCVDLDRQKITILQKGKSPIYEPGLEGLIKTNLEKQRLFFTSNLKEALVDSEVVFISVGTPPGEDGSADLSHVVDVARSIGKLMDHYMLIVTKSTVPVGTSTLVKKTIQGELNKRKSKLSFDIASNPEFLKEGAAVEDFLKPDRIVIGIDSERAEKVMRKLYKPFLLNNHPILFMDIPSAELTKYAANAMLATRISFMNEIAKLAEMVNADISMVRKGIGSDPRIGNKFIYPGTGYGGSCFPKDVKALIRIGEDHHLSLELIKSVERVNERQKNILVEKILAHYKGKVKGLTFALWGIAFKPQTDDIREAPALTIIRRLVDLGAGIRGYDPAAMKEARKIMGGQIYIAHDQYDALNGADALVLVTEWTEFRQPDLSRIAKLLKRPVIFDGRNIYDPEELREQGFIYYGIGRK